MKRILMLDTPESCVTDTYTNVYIVV